MPKRAFFQAWCEPVLFIFVFLLCSRPLVLCKMCVKPCLPVFVGSAVGYRDCAAARAEVSEWVLGPRQCSKKQRALGARRRREKKRTCAW